MAVSNKSHKKHKHSKSLKKRKNAGKKPERRFPVHPVTVSNVLYPTGMSAPMPYQFPMTGQNPYSASGIVNGLNTAFNTNRENGSTIPLVKDTVSRTHTNIDY